MAVIYSRAQLDAIRAVLDTVQSVGQAQAAVRATLDMAEKAREDISQWILESTWRTQAKNDIANKVVVLRSQAQQIVGDPTMAVGSLWSEQLRGSCLDLWLYALLVSEEFPPDESSAWERYKATVSSASSDLAYGVSQAPKNIIAAVSTVAETVGKTAEGVLSGVLGPLKWYLLGAGALVAVAAVIAYRKGLL